MLGPDPAARRGHAGRVANSPGAGVARRSPGGKCMERSRVLVVDDHPLFRQGVRYTLESSGEFEIIGEAADGQQAIKLAEQLGPDVMLVDINLPGLNGLEVARVVRRRQPQTALIILTVYED